MTRFACAAIFLTFSGFFAHAQTSILGFTPSHSTRETEIESKFKSIPTPDEERRQHRIFTSEPHVAGSKRNNELAEYIRRRMAQAGTRRRRHPPLRHLRHESEERIAGNDRSHALPGHAARNAARRRR